MCSGLALKQIWFLSPDMTTVPSSVHRYWDERYGDYYYYNENTGESTWENPAEVKHNNAHDDSSMRRRSSDEWFVRVDVEADHSHDKDILLIESRLKAEAEKVHRNTMTAIRLYGCCFCFHGCCCEAPFAAIEAACRAPCYLLGAIACATTCQFMRSHELAREGALFLGLALSLGTVPMLLPCWAYASFDAHVDGWKLGPVPTLLGYVDPRRLCVVSYGQGANADNVDVIETCSMDTWPGAILHPPYRYRCRVAKSLRLGLKACCVDFAFDSSSTAAHPSAAPQNHYNFSEHDDDPMYAPRKYAPPIFAEQPLP